MSSSNSIDERNVEAFIKEVNKRTERTEREYKNSDDYIYSKVFDLIYNTFGNLCSNIKDDYFYNQKFGEINLDNYKKDYTMYYTLRYLNQLKNIHGDKYYPMLRKIYKSKNKFDLDVNIHKKIINLIQSDC
jgi:hypothetical protein